MAGSHTGFDPEQSEPARQPTHRWAAVSQTVVGPPQVVLSTHSTQVLVPTSHADLAPPQ
jgi:hypothetical protein